MSECSYSAVLPSLSLRLVGLLAEAIVPVIIAEAYVTPEPFVL